MIYRNPCFCVCRLLGPHVRSLLTRSPRLTDAEWEEEAATSALCILWACATGISILIRVMRFDVPNLTVTPPGPARPHHGHGGADVPSS